MTVSGGRSIRSWARIGEPRGDQAARILVMVALCMARGVRRFENAAILFCRPATTMAFPRKSARMPVPATARGFIENIRSRRETLAPAAASKPVAVCPGHRLVTTTPCGRSSSCRASPRARKKTSRERRDYISVTLDDPSFPAAICATLSETETAGEYASSGPADRPKTPRSTERGRLPLLIPVSLPDCAP
jgi:hypothetical protein